MSVSRNYGVLRIIRVRRSAHKTRHLEKNPPGLLSEEHLVHVLAERETTIGRALSNDLILMDPTVSREHARLILTDEGWCIHNISEQNALQINGTTIAAGSQSPIQSQDFLLLGNTMLQLVAPNQPMASPLPSLTINQTSDIALPTTPHPAGADQDTSTRILNALPLSPPEKSSRLNGKRPLENLPVPLSPALDQEPLSDQKRDSQAWDESDKFHDNSSITLQFALPQRFKKQVRWALVGIILVFLLLSALTAIILNNLLGIVSLIQESPLNVLSVLSIPIVTALGINLLVNFIDRYEREPWFLRLAAFLWGAVIAIPPTTFIEGNIDALRATILGPQAGKALHALFSALNAGITEETVKGLGLLLLFIVLRDEFDNITDGIVYGALIGAGFAMLENIFYFAGNPKAFVFLLIGRIVLGWLSHSTFTICFGISLGYMRHTRVRWQHIVIPLIGYAISVGLHTAFDFINFFANSLVLASPDNTSIVMFSVVASIGDYILPFIAQMVIIYCLIKSLAHEAAVIREFLASEVSSGIITVDEYALLQHSFLRTKIERRVLFYHGFKQWLRVKALYQTEIGLAFRKWHVSMGDKPKLGYVQPEDAYRRRIQRLRYHIYLAENPKPLT
ncbi:hypothetical protein KDW_34130 [Dictyobacter vulcani]|uniref:FHA domain-containing protein n=1 Tax=Dictyobacter vulcani TaxID=2607529 RepID=A0A5J4KS08_9CHLR|nr:PrsW family glutamic-type intramembrane protease [Dictyobacter vulcani]GER89251.1 hypothetical protein KDW_34130 [Dictyobacter vulcani]